MGTVYHLAATATGRGYGEVMRPVAGAWRRAARGRRDARKTLAGGVR